MTFCTVDQAIAHLKTGQMIVVVDDDDRENEGELVIPACFADAAAINFMAKHGRGLICLAMTRQRIAALGLPAMVAHNRSRHQTAFTVSIEAREGVSTGISAFDRARTIAVAIDPRCGREDLASPGHVFPLVAQDGGVLVRAGHTEASVDLARLAGLNPSAVICEIMHDDGTMARGVDLQAFAQTHSLPILTIADLIAFRRQRERLVRCLSTEHVESSLIGPAVLHVYENTLTQRQHLVLVKGTFDNDHPPLVRVHTLNLAPDLLGVSHTLHRAAAALKDAPAGILVIMNTHDGMHDVPPSTILREYGIGAQILVDLGVHRMILLSGTTRTIVGLEGYDLDVIEVRGF
jgi:3,4-dihydroxy 2-butanone 4-phosphate synthase/GTP cyclohydrolase II